MVRGHLEARECGLHFIVGSGILFKTSGGAVFARLVLLAQERRGYGNHCELIKLARRRAEKGGHDARVANIEGRTSKAPHLTGLPGCLTLLIPEKDGTVESIFAQFRWLRTWFPERAWVAGPRPLEIDDNLRCWTVEEAAARAGQRIVSPPAR